MPELQPHPVDSNQSGPLRRGDLRPSAAVWSGRLDDHGDRLRVVGGGDQEQSLSGEWKPSDSLEEQVLELPGERQRPGQRLQPGQLSGGESCGDLAEGERVAARFGDELAADLRRRFDDDVASEHRLGGVSGKPAEPEMRETGCRERGEPILAGREQHDDSLGVEPPRDEQQRVGRRAIEPLGVVEQTGDRSRLREFGEE